MMKQNIQIVPMNKEEQKELSASYGFYPTGYGTVLVASSDRGICYVGIGEKERMRAALKQTYPDATLQERQTALQRLAVQFIDNPFTKAALTLHIAGTAFQQEVWKALLQVPPGKLASYRSIAEALGRSKAVRAVGSAIGRNPVSCIIPCHRIIRSDGSLGGYAWGLEIKQQIIDKEKQLCQSQNS